MTTPTELGELFLQVGRQLRRQQQDLSLPPHQFRALRLIAAGPLRPARLAEKLCITPRAVTDVVDVLIAEGLVSSTADPTDRRAKVLDVTDEGRERLERLVSERKEVAARQFARLDDEDQNHLAKLLRTLLEDN